MKQLELFPPMKMKLVGGTDQNNVIPHRGSYDAAGLDLRCSHDVILSAVEPTLVRTGIKVAIPKGHFGLVTPRSGLGTKEGTCMRNTVGIIDADYRGEILLTMYLDGLTKDTRAFKAGDRVAQLIIIPCISPDIVIVDELVETGRGEAGYGSTGVV